MGKPKSKETRKWGWQTWTILFLIGFIAATLASPLISSVFLEKDCVCKNSHKFSGLVEDCCCDYKTVDNLNSHILCPLLHDLVKTPFFRYFKVRLWCDCPFWPNDGMCSLRDCSVCECPEQEFPETFKRPERQISHDDLICREGKPQASVDRTLDKREFRGWMETDNPWTYDNETDNAELTYVNLQLNPERYTGYTGPSAHRIWESIYKDNYLEGVPGDASTERHVLYKLLSGLHSSISVHIAAEYLLDEAKDQWGPNPSLLYERVLKYPERVTNLYFTFLFVLRSVTKAAGYLAEAEYNTGNPVKDQMTLSLVRKLVYNRDLQAACPIPFDEAKLWKGQNGDQLKRQIQMQFRNISALMDCVGCEKCRLWGKLQILGLATALKILFSVDSNDYLKQSLQLERNEVIALINLVNQLSESIQSMHALVSIADKPVKESDISAPSIQTV
eukprot:Gb_20370 [translate_table: standard]